MLWKLILVIVSTCYISGASCFLDKDSAFYGDWHALSGAKLTIKEVDQKKGQIEVSFKSPSQLHNDGPHKGYGLIGNAGKFITETAQLTKPSYIVPISFSIRFPDNSIIAWTGGFYMSKGERVMICSWHLAQPKAMNFTNHINTGSTVFAHSPPKK